MAFAPWLTTPNELTEHQWGLVLAGGDGKRLQEFLLRDFNCTRPKQFCTIIGTRSMLRHTIDRVSSLIPQSRLLTVISSHHRSYVAEELCDQEQKNIVVEPSNCETAPGILLPLFRIFLSDVRAVVAIFPSDHFILEEERFMQHVRAALSYVWDKKDLIVTLGIRPTSLQPDYGWIEQGEWLGLEGGMKLYGVKRFWEKPNEDLRQQLFANGCLWNTLTLVGRAETFVGLFQEYAPQVFRPFQRIWNVLDTPREAEVTEQVFRELPSVTFSNAVLERAPERLCVLPVNGVYWSDWGDENRIRTDIARLKRPKRARRTSQPVRVEADILATKVRPRVVAAHQVAEENSVSLQLDIDESTIELNHWLHI